MRILQRGRRRDGYLETSRNIADCLLAIEDKFFMTNRRIIAKERYSFYHRLSSLRVSLGFPGIPSSELDLVTTPPLREAVTSSAMNKETVDDVTTTVFVRPHAATPPPLGSRYVTAEIAFDRLYHRPSAS
ncbi:hypothetical protein EVAR_94669_1 [Eumeta japonica]|uniref:Uncharacterized protein n=1 Tax=Eumeta variegata TaxID=151549 RepID=A0A4C1UU57_EUMVA|nr:hypothetical protein EVAR_94669_1 [Eumeta japonica]